MSHWRYYWIALITIVNREIFRFISIWKQTILPSAISMTLYYVIFGNLVGDRIGEMEGYSYISFIAPGLIMMAIITNSYSNVVSSFYGMRFQKNVEEILVSPMPNWLIISGFIIGGIARGIVVGMAVSLLSLLFADITVKHVFLTFVVIIFTSGLFSLMGFFNAIFAKSFDDIAIIPTFVLTPLTYLGGVFYSINLLPEFWQVISYFNPILYIINAFRYGILGVSDVNVYGAIFIILLFNLIFFFINLYLLRRGTGLKE